MALENTTDLFGNCPELKLVYQSMFEMMADSVVDLVCTQAKEGYLYNEEQFNQIRNSIEGISNVPGLAERIAEFKEFIDTLDANSDGEIDVVVNLQTQINNIVNSMEMIKVDVEAAKEEARKCQLDLAEYKVSVTNIISEINTRINNIDNRVTVVENKVEEHTTQINEIRVRQAGYEQVLGELEGLSKDMIDEKRCEDRKLHLDAINAGLAAFSAKLSQGCATYFTYPVAEPPLGDPEVGPVAPPESPDSPPIAE